LLLRSQLQDVQQNVYDLTAFITEVYAYFLVHVLLFRIATHSPGYYPNPKSAPNSLLHPMLTPLHEHLYLYCREYNTLPSAIKPHHRLSASPTSTTTRASHTISTHGASFPPDYAKLMTVAQPPGAGKPRLTDELSKKHVTVACTLRYGEQSGYPPGIWRRRSFCGTPCGLAGSMG